MKIFLTFYLKRINQVIERWSACLVLLVGDVLFFEVSVKMSLTSTTPNVLAACVMASHYDRFIMLNMEPRLFQKNWDRISDKQAQSIRVRSVSWLELHRVAVAFIAKYISAVSLRKWQVTVIF